MFRLLLFLLSASLALAAPPGPSPAAELRAVWVDAFNAGIRTPAEVEKLVAEARAANLNTLIVQVRRRADSLYIKSLEPPVEDPSYAPDFDALACVIEKAHAAGLQVHAWINAMPVWRRGQAPPRDPKHIFNTRGPSATGRDNWLTCTPEAEMVYPVGYFLDPGHPEAAAHVAAVVRSVVQNYAVDGIHLDYIRYPETVGATPETGAPVGYNKASLERFRKRYGVEGTPAANDPLWSAWRREQVTNLVRRIYLEAVEINPRIKISAAVISWGDGPDKPADWVRSNAYNRIYQDWQAWLREGILDLAVPMNYFRASDAKTRAFYQRWVKFEQRYKHGRHLAVGIGAYLNSPQENLAQLRQALDPLRRRRKHAVDGVSFFSYANNQKTMAELAALFPAPVPVPLMKWKERPQRGYLCGILDGADGVRVEIARKRRLGWPRQFTVADANGFFGAVHLKPGTYRVKIPERNLTSLLMRVEPGRVTRVDLGAVSGRP